MSNPPPTEINDHSQSLFRANKKEESITSLQHANAKELRFRIRVFRKLTRFVENLLVKILNWFFSLSRETRNIVSSIDAFNSCETLGFRTEGKFVQAREPSSCIQLAMRLVRYVNTVGWQGGGDGMQTERDKRRAAHDCVSAAVCSAVRP